MPVDGGDAIEGASFRSFQFQLFAVPIHQPVTFPNIETGSDPMSVATTHHLDDRALVVMFNRLGGVHVVAVVDEMHSVARYCNTLRAIYGGSACIPYATGEAISRSSASIVFVSDDLHILSPCALVVDAAHWRRRSSGQR